MCAGSGHPDSGRLLVHCCMLLSKLLPCMCRQQPPGQQVPAGTLLHAAGQAVGG